MIDPTSITALIIASASAFVGILHEIHLKKCHSLCCSSDCTNNNSRDSSPTIITPIINKQSLV